MVHQHRNVFMSLKGREIGFKGRIGQNILGHFAEEIAATSSTDNKACNLPGTPRCTFLVTFSNDHKLVASSHGNHSINISRLSTGEHIQTLTGHPRSPWCVTFHPSSNEILASGCLGGEVRVWDLQGSSEVWQSDNHSMIASLSFHPRDQVLAIATNDQILLWDWRQPVPFASVSISSPLEKVRLVRFSPLGHNLLTGIANAPVDEEEPEYENLDVQHEAYQSTARHSRHGVPEHLNPYPRPARIDPNLHGSYSASLPPSHGPSGSRQPRRPMSPEQSETLEEAREYAAAVTLTALGLRRVNPASNLSHNFSYTGWQTGDQRLPNEQPDVRENIFSRGARHQSEVGSDVGTQNEPDRVGMAFGVRGGISSWNHGRSSDESRGETRSSDDAGSSEDWPGADTSTENSHSTIDNMSHSSTAPVYVNMDVTNGDERRVARTSVSIPQTHADESRSDGLPHEARLQQLPTSSENRTYENQNLVSATNDPIAASSECDQGSLALEDEMRPLDLVSGNKYGTIPSTSSQQVQDNCETQNFSSSSTKNKDCHSPEAKRHCPDFNGQDQALKMNELNQSHDGPSSSSGYERSTTIGHATHQRLSFSDAEVSSAVQDMVPSTSSHPSSSGSETAVSSSLPCCPSSRGARPQLADAKSNRGLTEAAPTQANCSSTSHVALSGGAVTSSMDSEAQMQPALQSQTLTRPHAAVMHRSISGIADPPRAFTAHLGTIPHTAPPDSTSQSDNDASQSRHNTSQSVSGPSYAVDSTSHSVSRTPSEFVNTSASQSVNSTSQLNSISQSVNTSQCMPSTSPVTSVPSHPPVNYENSGASQIRPPQFGTGLGLQRGMRALHFGSVDNGDRVPVTSGSNLNNPLDLSIARTGSATEPDVRGIIHNMLQPERYAESSTNSIQPPCHRSIPDEVPAQSDSGNSSQSETRREVSPPSAAYQPCNFNQQRQDTRPNHESPVSSQYQTEPQPPIPQGMDLTIPNTRQGTRPSPYAPTSNRARASTARHPGYTQSSYTDEQPVTGASHAPAPLTDPLSTLQPTNPFPSSDAASRYRRYNLWRSPGLHRQRSGGSSQTADPRDNEPLGGDNQMEEPRAGVVYGARRVAPLHTRRHLHVALLNQPSRQMTDMERTDMAARVQRRLLRQSRQGPLRAQLGRLSGQFSGHHHHSRNSIFDEAYQPPPPVIHATINRAIASAFAGRGETAVANNIGNTTYRLQWWDFSEFELPDISDGDHNVIVPHCKLHNDASCDVSQDGRHLAAFVPSPLGFPDDGVLAIYSLMPHNFGDVLYTKSFGPNAITVSISPLGRFVMVGLASRKLHLHMASKQLIGMIYKLHKEGASEDSLLYVCDVDHACSETERRHHVSVNTVKWIPRPGGGLVYGTNRGDLRICLPSNFTAPEDLTSDCNYRPDYSSIDDSPRHDLVHRRRSYMYMYQEFGLRNLGLHHPSSSSASAGVSVLTTPERRARGTQTPQRELFTTATQTDEPVSQ